MRWAAAVATWIGLIAIATWASWSPPRGGPNEFLLIIASWGLSIVCLLASMKLPASALEVEPGPAPRSPVLTVRAIAVVPACALVATFLLLPGQAAVSDLKEILHRGNLGDRWDSLLFELVPFAIAGLGIWKLVRQWRLLKYGEIAEGNVDVVTKGSVTYGFETPDGKEQVGRGWAEWELWPGDLVTVFYDPANPRKSVALGASLFEVPPAPIA